MMGKMVRDGLVAVAGRMWVFVPIMILLWGCAASERAVSLSDMNNPDPTVRIRAIKWAGENKLDSALPRLVDLLQDEDRAIRYYAIAALRHITGTDHGYDFKSDARTRSEAIKRWQAELAKER